MVHIAAKPKSPTPAIARALVPLCGLVLLGDACGWVLNINPGARGVFLQVGVGSYAGFHQSGGTPQNNATINTVSVTVPAAQVGRGTAQSMTSTSTQAISFYDGFTVCTPPAQVYIGGWVRRPGGGPGSGVLSVTSPASLTSGTLTIPFTQISWTSTALGDPTPNIPAGTFTGGTQALVTIAPNTWVENCHTFSYANTVVRGAGTYTGQVTYTLTVP
jgi:hypothetical protein